MATNRTTFSDAVSAATALHSLRGVDRLLTLTVNALDLPYDNQRAWALKQELAELRTQVTQIMGTTSTLVTRLSAEIESDLRT